MLVSADIHLALGQRPSATAILQWYEKSFRSRGVLPQRLPDDQLEFTVPLGADADGNNWEPSLSVVSRGTISVSLTESGFRVDADVRPRIWINALPVVFLVAISGGVALSEPPLNYLLALCGLPLILASWAICWTKVRGVLYETNRAIENSYNSRAPSNAEPLLPSN